jgi:purine-binding chemotaxis protein CheW
MENQIVVFELSSELYGVSISSVESIIKMQAITKMPHAPKFVEGVTNLRGKVLPVVDLRKRFGLADTTSTRNSRIIVISVNGMEVGMVVDGVSEVLTIQDENIEPTPMITSTLDSTFITGIAKIDQRLIILLDLGKVLSTQEQESVTRVEQAA